MTTTDDQDLKGQALDDALEAAGLPKTGSADEKRARLAAGGEPAAEPAASSTTRVRLRYATIGVAAGGEIEVEAAEAKKLIANGNADPV